VKNLFTQLGRWSWLVTLPVAVFFVLWLWLTVEHYVDFGVRYDAKVSLLKAGQEQFGYLKRRVRLSLFSRSLDSVKSESSLETISLFVPESSLLQLNDNLPHSGFRYVKGMIRNGEKIEKVKLRYRGDTILHWGYPKKSFRIKTKKKSLFEGMRKFNVIAPKSHILVVNHLSYELARDLGLMAPRSKMVNLVLNGRYQGIYVLVEQLEELTLRNSGRMPGDVYAGELFGKDRRHGISTKVFDHPGVWDKIAVNNHFEENSYAPLDRLTTLIHQPQTESIQEDLMNLLDVEAWGKFSAYQTLLQTFHFDEEHNWRLYYDPWRTEFVPIVWDPIGWVSESSGKKPIALDIVRTQLLEVLFHNARFLKARHHAISDFFASNKDALFLEAAAKLVEDLRPLVPVDPHLRKSNAITLKSMDNYQGRIKRAFDALRRGYLGGQTRLFYAEKDASETLIALRTEGRAPVKDVVLRFAAPVASPLQTHVTYAMNGEKFRKDISGNVAIQGSSVSLNTDLLSNFVDDYREDIKMSSKRVLPGHYLVEMVGIAEDNRLLEVSHENHLAESVQATRKNTLPHAEFVEQFHNVDERPNQPIEVWRGEVVISNVVHVYRDVLIKAGTTIRLKSGASVIFHGQVIAAGEADNRVMFVPFQEVQEPWGTVALKGRGSDGSKFRFCEFRAGSGYKSPLFEYSGMFSVHDVKAVVVDQCVFRDNLVVDDMVHAVYSTIHIKDSQFIGSLSDALDLDICVATIERCRFVESGNDAVDLMTTKAVLIDSVLLSSGDKGVSVGEGSELIAVNNLFEHNEIAVQSKDGSQAVIYNSTMSNNKQALHAYKKNWRYNAGGEIFVYKSVIEGNERGVTARKKSRVEIYDSYLDVIPKRGSKRVYLSKSVDSKNREKASFRMKWVEPQDIAVLKKKKELVAFGLDSARRGVERLD